MGWRLASGHAIFSSRDRAGTGTHETAHRSTLSSCLGSGFPSLNMFLGRSGAGTQRANWRFGKEPSQGVRICRGVGRSSLGWATHAFFTPGAFIAALTELIFRGGRWNMYGWGGACDYCPPPPMCFTNRDLLARLSPAPGTFLTILLRLMEGIGIGHDRN